MTEKSPIHAIRLKPGQDLKNELQKFVTDQNIQAGWIMTAIGSLDEYNLRFANCDKGTAAKGFYEIITLSGTVSANGCHLHIAISDRNGQLVGGHLLEGCRIYTTAEIIIGVSGEHIFSRENDGSTPWKELQIKRKDAGE